MKNGQKDFKAMLYRHGLDRDLHSLGAIARFLNYDEGCFRAKVSKMTFRHAELKRIFTMLKFSDGEILEVMT